jgi:hypothetical protein
MTGKWARMVGVLAVAVILMTVPAFGEDPIGPENKDYGGDGGGGGGGSCTYCTETHCGCASPAPGMRLSSWSCACSSLTCTQDCTYVPV